MWLYAMVCFVWLSRQLRTTHVVEDQIYACVHKVHVQYVDVVNVSAGFVLLLALVMHACMLTCCPHRRSFWTYP